MRFRLPAALALAAALAPLAAGAAGDKLRLGIFGDGKGSGPLLTRAELRECLRLQDSVRTGNEAAASEREGLEKEKAELVRLGAELKAQLETLDRTSQEAIDQFKARAEARDKAIGEFETRSNAFNAKIEALNTSRNTFRQRCNDRRFDQLDEEAIRAGK